MEFKSDLSYRNLPTILSIAIRVCSRINTRCKSEMSRSFCDSYASCSNIGTQQFSNIYRSLSLPPLLSFTSGARSRYEVARIRSFSSHPDRSRFGDLASFILGSSSAPNGSLLLLKISRAQSTSDLLISPRARLFFRSSAVVSHDGRSFDGSRFYNTYDISICRSCDHTQIVL